MAAVTRSAVAGVTPASALITRETVFRLTPAMSATWRMVGRVAFMPRSRALLASPPPDP